MATKDEIRSAVFSNKNFKREKFAFLGQDVELRQPSVGQIGKLANEANKKNKLIEIIIDSSFVPGTNEKLFTNADYDQLLEVPASEWVADFTKAWTKLSGNPEETEKN